MNIIQQANQHQKNYRIINAGKNNKERVVSKVLHQDFHQENKLVFYIIPTSLKKLSILKRQKEKMKMIMNQIKF